MFTALSHSNLIYILLQYLKKIVLID